MSNRVQTELTEMFNMVGVFLVQIIVKFVMKQHFVHNAIKISLLKTVLVDQTCNNFPLVIYWFLNVLVVSLLLVKFVKPVWWVVNLVLLHKAVKIVLKVWF